MQTCDELAGTTKCPVCGLDFAHYHDDFENERETKCRPAFERWYTEAVAGWCMEEGERHGLGIPPLSDTKPLRFSGWGITWGSLRADKREHAEANVFRRMFGVNGVYAEPMMQAIWLVWKSAWFHEDWREMYTHRFLFDPEHEEMLGSGI